MLNLQFLALVPAAALAPVWGLGGGVGGSGGGGGWWGVAGVGLWSGGGVWGVGCGGVWGCGEFCGGASQLNARRGHINTERTHH